MSNILRSIAAIILGAIVTVLVISGVQFISHQIYPPPPGLDPKDLEAMKAVMAALPAGALAWVAASWCLGAFCGSWAACLLKPRYRRLAVVIVASLVIVGTIMNARMVPTPTWLLSIGLLAPIPLGLLAERISR